MKNNPLLLFVICCAIPLILAYSALKLDWLPTAITNNGEFLQQQVKYENWPQDNHKQWTIALNYSSGWKSIDAQPNLQPASLYLIDHMGLVVLEYPFKTQPQENRLVQKGLLKDLKKLLSYSRSS